MIATQEETVEARIPLAYRDQCAHLLVPLNECRQAEHYLPWKCEEERHSYENCDYELVMERTLKMQKIREEEAKLKQPAIPLIPKPANASSSSFLSPSQRDPVEPCLSIPERREVKRNNCNPSVKLLQKSTATTPRRTKMATRSRELHRPPQANQACR